MVGCVFGFQASVPVRSRVENGKIVFAEFSYRGEVTPTFPTRLNEGPKPTRLA